MCVGRRVFGGGGGERGVVRIRLIESGSGTVVPEVAERERTENRVEERLAGKRSTADHGGAYAQQSCGGPPTWRPLPPPARGWAGGDALSPSLLLGRRERGGARRRPHARVRHRRAVRMHSG